MIISAWAVFNRPLLMERAAHAHVLLISSMLLMQPRALAHHTSALSAVLQRRTCAHTGGVPPRYIARRPPPAARRAPAPGRASGLAPRPPGRDRRPPDRRRGEGAPPLHRCNMAILFYTHHSKCTPDQMLSRLSTVCSREKSVTGPYSCTHMHTTMCMRGRYSHTHVTA